MHIGDCKALFTEDDLPKAEYKNNYSKKKEGQISYARYNGKTFSSYSMKESEIKGVATDLYVFSGKGFNVLLFGRELCRSDFTRDIESIRNIVEMSTSSRNVFSACDATKEKELLERMPIIIKKEDKEIWEKVGARSYEKTLKSALTSLNKKLMQYKDAYEERLLSPDDIEIMKLLDELQKNHPNSAEFRKYLETGIFAPLKILFPSKTEKFSSEQLGSYFEYIDYLYSKFDVILPGILDASLKKNAPSSRGLKELFERKYPLIFLTKEIFRGWGYTKAEKENRILQLHKYMEMVDAFTKE